MQTTLPFKPLSEQGDKGSEDDVNDVEAECDLGGRESGDDIVIVDDDETSAAAAAPRASNQPSKKKAKTMAKESLSYPCLPTVKLKGLVKENPEFKKENLLKDAKVGEGAKNSHICVIRPPSFYIKVVLSSGNSGTVRNQ